MNLAEAILNESHLQKGPPCGVGRLFLELDPGDAKTLVDAMADRNVQFTTISRALARSGHRMSDFTLRRHARHDCGCEQ